MLVVCVPSAFVFDLSAAKLQSVVWVRVVWCGVVLVVWHAEKPVCRFINAPVYIQNVSVCASKTPVSRLLVSFRTAEDEQLYQVRQLALKLQMGKTERLLW